MIRQAFICDAIRTPFGRFGGSLSSIRPDDLGAHVIRALMDRNPSVNWNEVDDVVFGCANQAGEDCRNVARFSSLLAGMPASVPGVTVNRLCGSSLDAIGSTARAIRSGDYSLAIAGGVESMSRAPLVMAKSSTAFDRSQVLYDTTIGIRFVNPAWKKVFGAEIMAETAENVAAEFGIDRESQDRFAVRSHEKALRAQREGVFESEIVGVPPTGNKSSSGSGTAAKVVTMDEHPRETNMDMMRSLKGVVRSNGTVTAGNASGVNDGAAALLLASTDAISRYNLTPRARVVGMAVAGVLPRIMGMGPLPAVQKLLQQTKRSLHEDVDIIEMNEAFAAQALAVTRQLGLSDDDERVNVYGGAIALGHPLGASGGRLVTTAINALERRGGRCAVIGMCIGNGQGIALMIDREI